MAGGLPHLRACLKAFMTGAADTWKCFGEQYEADRVIAKLSAEARAKIYINPTNDHSEGALGRLRRAMREYTRLLLSMHNAKSKYAINGTREFMRSDAVTSSLRVWLRGEARRRIDSGRDQQRRRELIEYQNTAVDQKKQAEIARKEKEAARKAELANLVPLVDVDEIQAKHKSILAADIVKQINWHRKFVEKDVIPQKTFVAALSKADKVILLMVAVTRFNTDILPKLQLLASAAMTSGSLVDIDVPAGDIDMSWEEQEELEDNDMLDDY
jgi:hypothetical protein